MSSHAKVVKGLSAIEAVADRPHGSLHACRAARPGDVVGTVAGEVALLGKVPAQQDVGVLAGAALQGQWESGADRQSGVDAKPGVLGHLVPLVPGERPAHRGTSSRPAAGCPRFAGHSSSGGLQDLASQCLPDRAAPAS